MSLQSNDYSACPFCVSLEDQKRFITARTIELIFSYIILSAGLFLTLAVALGTLRFDGRVALLTTVGGLVVILLVGIIITTVSPTRTLYYFRDATERIHCERWYPVSIPEAPRAQDSLAHSPVLRLSRSPFVWGRFVAPNGRVYDMRRVWLQDGVAPDTCQIYSCKTADHQRITGLTLSDLLDLRPGTVTQPVAASHQSRA